MIYIKNNMDKIQKFVSENIEVILIGILIIVLLYLLMDRRERFNNNLLSVKQCDFNDPNLSGKCKRTLKNYCNLRGTCKQTLNKYCNLQRIIRKSVVSSLRHASDIKNTP